MQPLSPHDPREIATYRLRGRLGNGGQGVVFLADSADGRAVAIKVLHAFSRADDRFARELAAVQQVSPAWVARVIDADLEARPPYIVSEYVEGPSLAHAVSTSGPFAPEPLIRLASGLMMALAAIHRAGIVHRDLKPANVLLGSDGPRLIDFGVARSSDMTATTSGNVIGTPLYLAPEAFLGQRTEAPADVFAWASVVFFAATGAHAFHAVEIPAVMHRILNDEPSLDALPEPLRAPVASALVKDPAARPTAADLLLELTGIGHSTPLPRAVGRSAGPAAQPNGAGQVDAVPEQSAGGAGAGRRVLVVGAATAAAVAVVAAVFLVKDRGSGTAGRTPASAAPSAAAKPKPTPDEPSASPSKSADPKASTTSEPTHVKRTTEPKSPFPAEQASGSTRIYYNATRKDHAQRSAKLIAQGFQPVSLSVGEGERYTAVWREQPGPALRTFQGLSPKATMDVLAKGFKDGYRLKLITGLGPWASASYAGVLIQQDAKPFNLSYWRLTKADFVAKNQDYHDRGRYTLRWLSAYGPPGDRRYAAIWEPRTDTDDWTTTVDLPWAAHQQAAAKLEKQGYRPAMVTTTADRRYTAVWQQDKTPYLHFGDLTPGAFRAKLTEAKGYYPSALQVAGDAEHPYFTAVWARE